jgi:hypothetical protein
MSDKKIVSKEVAALVGAHIVAGESSVVMRGYAATVAAFARVGGYEERGFASDNIPRLQVSIAAARVGAAWENLTVEEQATKVQAAQATAKRYAEKGTGICKQATAKGLNLSDVQAAESEEVAIELVKGFFSDNDLYTQEALFAHFNFAQSKGKEPSKKPAAPAAPADDEERQTPVGVNGTPSTGSDLVAHVRAAFDALPHEERVRFSEAFILELFPYAPSAVLNTLPLDTVYALLEGNKERIERNARREEAEKADAERAAAAAAERATVAQSAPKGKRKAKAETVAV